MTSNNIFSNKLYLPAVQTHQAKVIPMHAAPLDEWITLLEAAKLFTSPKHPGGILPKSLKNKTFKKKGKPAQLPWYAYTYGPAGWFFHKPTLMGLRKVIHHITLTAA